MHAEKCGEGPQCGPQCRERAQTIVFTSVVRVIPLLLRTNLAQTQQRMSKRHQFLCFRSILSNRSNLCLLHAACAPIRLLQG
jgi:hypothetical protein